LLGEAINKISDPPQVFICSSAVLQEAKRLFAALQSSDVLPSATRAEPAPATPASCVPRSSHGGGTLSFALMHV